MLQKLLTIFLLALTLTGWSMVYILWTLKTRPTASVVIPSNVVTNNNNSSRIWGNDQDLAISGSDSQQVKYTSQNFHFSWSLDNVFSFMHFPATAPATYAARFDRPNPNQSLQRNRQALVGFNFKPYDEITLEVWPNTSPQLIFSSSVDFWSDVVGAHRRILEQSLVTINGQQIFRTTEIDGEAGVYGYYYYFLTPSFLIVIGTTDITHDEIEKFLQTFKVNSI